MNILGTTLPHDYGHDLRHGRSAIESQATRLTAFADSRPGSVLASEYIALSSRVEPHATEVTADRRRQRIYSRTTGGRLRERAKSYAKALANDILR